MQLNLSVDKASRKGSRKGHQGGYREDEGEWGALDVDDMGDGDEELFHNKAELVASAISSIEVKRSPDYIYNIISPTLTLTVKHPKFS